MRTTVFTVNEEPYCLWEEDLSERNLAFLKGLDPDYFEYTLNRHIFSDDEKRASVALRVSLHHSIETLFSLLGAYIQAPDCAYAWIAKYSNSDLRAFVKRVSEGDPSTITKLNILSVTWENVANLIFATYMPATERQSATAKQFASLWSALSRELTDQTLIDEYNSLKHGFRVRPGGFELSFGPQSNPDAAPQANEMHLLGKSKFGATFLKIETLWPEKQSRSLRSRRISVNWSIERVVLLHQLVHMSINNVVTGLKIANGVAPSECRFTRPENDEDFNRPWKHTPGVTDINFDNVIDETNARVVTKQELLEWLAKS